jgi:hypothetical protein
MTKQEDIYGKKLKKKGHRKRSNIFCKTCGLKYEHFRCGYNFQTIIEFLWKENKDENERWPNKRLHGRLGKLHEIKLIMWNIHIEECNIITLLNNKNILNRKNLKTEY